jgi:hypothetical protein
MAVSILDGQSFGQANFDTDFNLAGVEVVE